MPLTSTRAAIIRGITSCVPARKFDNLAETAGFSKKEIDKVVKMAGVKSRHVADESICSSDLCLSAAQDLMSALAWEPDSVDALVFVTQSPDYFLPSVSCLSHRDLGLDHHCACFDVGLGCSGYPYGLWLASMMLQGPGFKRALVLHGETPTRFAADSDRSVALLFGDAGSATALEVSEQECTDRWWFDLHTDGSGYKHLIIPGGGFRNRSASNPAECNVQMNGKQVFNFTIKRIPPLIESTLSGAGMSAEQLDYLIFHQSNKFIIQHLTKKVGLPKEKIPMSIEDFGSTGGPSVPLTIAKGDLDRPSDRNLRLLLLGYGVGLSWGSALVDLHPNAYLNHVELATHQAVMN